MSVQSSRTGRHDRAGPSRGTGGHRRKSERAQLSSSLPSLAGLARSKEGDRLTYSSKSRNDASTRDHDEHGHLLAVRPGARVVLDRRVLNVDSRFGRHRRRTRRLRPERGPRKRREGRPVIVTIVMVMGEVRREMRGVEGELGGCRMGSGGRRRRMRRAGRRRGRRRDYCRMRRRHCRGKRCSKGRRCGWTETPMRSTVGVRPAVGRGGAPNSARARSLIG